MNRAPTKTRFAPSPTGRLHLGNMRTALFCALLARSLGGVFLLRIEDTDASRSREDYTVGLMEDLRWLGLEWQEGHGVGGRFGPYRQSERRDIYQGFYNALVNADLAYPCFCSDRELKLTRKAQLAAGQAPRYPGTCARLSSQDVRRRLGEGGRPTLRFRVPRDRTVVFDDLVRGTQKFATDTIGDFIIRRADETPAFFFCNAVDDALMEVTHVLRGEDHLTNTPRQLLLLEALQLPAPRYGHIAMLVGEDGSPLSKRHGSRSIQELREAGYLPGAVLNYLGRLGHYYEDNGFMDLDHLAVAFGVEHLGRSPARYDERQLLHWQREAVDHADTPALWAWLASAGGAAVPAQQREAFVDAVKDNITLPDDARHWAGVVFGELPEFDTDSTRVIREAGSAFFETALAIADEVGLDYAGFAGELKARTGLRGKGLFMPLRIALTGVSEGPELARLMKLMPAAIVRARFERCRALASAQP